MQPSHERFFMDFSRIKNLRVNLGWSLGDLAARLDGAVTRQALNKYETGLMSPSPAVMIKIATVLGVKPLDLTMGEPDQISVKAFRKRQGLTAKDEKAIREQFVSQTRKYAEVRQKCGFLSDERHGLPPAPTVDASAASAEIVEDFAVRLRRLWRLGSAPINNLSSAVEDHGIFVIMLDAGEKFDGICAEISTESGKVKTFAVGIRKTTSGGRFRLTLAHEIGHLLLDTENEDTAFRFAGAFLAPKEILFRRLGMKRNRIKKAEFDATAFELGISLDALVKRAFDLEIIGAESYRFWNMQLRRGGVRQQDGIPVEESTWLRRNVLRGLSEGLLTESEAYEFLGDDVFKKTVETELPFTAWQLRKLNKTARRNLLKQAEDDACDLYESEPSMMVAETGEVYDDGGIS